MKFLLFTIAVFGSLCLRAQAIAKTNPQQASPLLLAGSDAFDPTRNAEADIENAVAEADRTGKRVLLDIGGDWCPWCKVLDKLFEENRDLQRLLDANYITVKIYYGATNKNEKALSGYSRVLGIPHFFILDSDGTLLHSQHVAELRENGSYTAEKLKQFLVQWAPP